MAPSAFLTAPSCPGVSHPFDSREFLHSREAGRAEPRHSCEPCSGFLPATSSAGSQYRVSLPGRTLPEEQFWEKVTTDLPLVRVKGDFIPGTPFSPHPHLLLHLNGIFSEHHEILF